MTRLIAFTAAWALGIVLTQAAFLHPVWSLLAVPLGLLLHFGWREQRWARLTLWALAGLLLGAGRFWLAAQPLADNHVARYTGHDEITLVGVVVAAPDRKLHQTDLCVKAEGLRISEASSSLDVVGKVLVGAPIYTDVRYGDRIAVTGTLKRPPNYADFSYRTVLARRGIHTMLEEGRITVLASHQANVVLDVLLRFRAYALKRLQRLLPEPQASLLAGILLGVENGIPNRLADSFSATGTTHIIAISGFNLTLIAGAFVWLAQMITGGRGKLWVALVGLWLYTFLVGGSWAVIRAAIMSSVGIFARSKQRPVHAATLLAFAAWVMSAVNPYVLWDVGFQLSIAATAGLIFFTDPVTTAGTWVLGRVLPSTFVKRLLPLIEEAIFVTLAAQLTTMPLILVTFGRLSLVTFLTNFMILPVQPLVMVFGGLALFLALVWLPLGQPIAWLAWTVLTYTIEVVRWTGDFSWASIPLRLTPAAAWGYYLALGSVRWWTGAAPHVRAWRRSWLQDRSAKQLQFGGAVVVAALTAAFLSGNALPDGRLHVHVLDVERGEAVFVQTPQGRQIVIDGGTDPAQLLDSVGDRLPFWDRTLDLVVLSSPDEARVAGLVPLLERFDVAQVAVSPLEGRGEHYDRWQQLLARRSPDTVMTLSAGQQWTPEPDFALHVCWPPAGTPGPLVLRLRYRERRLLLGGDATAQVEGALIAAGGNDLRSDVLLLPRHGAATAAQAAFLRAVKPEFVAVSLGRGQPLDRRLQARLMDIPIYRTDQHGRIHFKTDGQQVWVDVKRSPK